MLSRKSAALAWFCLPLGLLLATSNAINLWYVNSPDGGHIYYGFVSDNTFQVAYVNYMIHGNYIADYYDKVVATHYPPLWFWMVGSVGRLLSLTAIEVTRLAPILVLGLLPYLVFRVGE